MKDNLNSASRVAGNSLNGSDNKSCNLSGRSSLDRHNASPVQLTSNNGPNTHSHLPPVGSRTINNTGLPDNIKTGVERLSGYSMDDVKVHYNSSKPGQLRAHAYAQGTDIHVGPGQERHIPHEAWHVVQQKQGRVKPTIQMKRGVNVNDDKALEQEADIMGQKALQMKCNTCGKQENPRHGKTHRHHTTTQFKCTACEKEEDEKEVVQKSSHQSVFQLYPGDGMLPPGDCNYATYLGLRGAVESAKAIVSMLGSCKAGDSCTFLATKIAAITAEIAARVALDTTCFKGGDTGHRQQVQDKINMVNRCYRFFANSNCPQRLLQAMERVVEQARRVVTMVATAAIILAAIVALIVAIIALVEVIAALAASAVAAGVAAVVAALLILIQEISPESSTTPTA